MTPLSGDPLSGSDLDRFSRAAFTTVQFREGYTKREVDAFVARAVESLRSATSAMRPEDVRAVRFAPVRLQQGYDMAEVDAYLDDLEQHLRERAVPQPLPSDPLVDGIHPEGSSRVTRARIAALASWQGTTMSMRIALLIVSLGILIGLAVGLWPGDPSTRIALVYALIFSVSGAGVVIVAIQAFFLAVSLAQGVAYLTRHALRRIRGRSDAGGGAV